MERRGIVSLNLRADSGACGVYRRCVSASEANPPSHEPVSQSPPASGGWSNLPPRSRGLSLRTLIILRWLAIAGQTATVFLLVTTLHFPLPVWQCLVVIGTSVLVNLLATARLRQTDSRLPDGRQTGIHLGFDILQLSALLAFTGGLENPFCLLLVAPVTVAAASLPGRQALLLGLMVLISTTALFFWSMPLPWQRGADLNLPLLYRFGIGLALITGVIFTAAYAWRVAADAEKLELALATTQDVLQREQRLAALGGLAAAAAHELGTPLATIQVVAKELLRASPPDGPIAEDARLMLLQADRCRDILKRLSQRPEDGDELYTDVGLKALLNEVVDPHLGFDLDIAVSVRTPPGMAEPHVKRLAEVVHGLSAIVENAADFAAERVDVQATADGQWITIEVLDDGPGFAPDILPRLGEPYVTSRPQGKARQVLAAQLAAAAAAARPARRGKPAPPPPRFDPVVTPSQGGMGLGFFIARTLLERTGGQVTVGQGDGGPGANRGARVTVRWDRRALEAPASDQTAIHRRTA
ncbi:MAG: ActS/PrrB/RegB family redox-sensitive histidine kinase [Alphaproteobacteria bacterium]|nr:ActS/PrrB/RegB family redox-sensitive histidine kinase [Alphaproteobacteria bacterium]MBU2379168.1 ActS/PrrB/RegB family redox-sensitive histidine kinase [Alphaproteobacteria bacterium]